MTLIMCEEGRVHNGDIKQIDGMCPVVTGVCLGSIKQLRLMEVNTAIVRQSIPRLSLETRCIHDNKWCRA